MLDLLGAVIKRSFRLQSELGSAKLHRWQSDIGRLPPRCAFVVALAAAALVPSRALAVQDVGFFVDDHTGVMYADLAYKQVLSSNVMGRGGGMAIDLGLNFGNLVKKGTVIGVFGGFSPLFAGDAFNDDFIRDYQASYVREPEPTTLRGSSYYAEAFEGIALDEERRDSSVTAEYGLIVKWPNKYCPVLKLYRLHYLAVIDRTASSDASGNLTAYTEYLERDGWGVELVPFRGWGIHTEYLGTLSLGYLGFFLEWTNFEDARVAGRETTYLSDYVRPSFIDDYSTEIRWGFKLGASIL